MGLSLPQRHFKNSGSHSTCRPSTQVVQTREHRVAGMSHALARRINPSKQRASHGSSLGVWLSLWLISPRAVSPPSSRLTGMYTNKSSDNSWREYFHLLRLLHREYPSVFALQDRTGHPHSGTRRIGYPSAVANGL